MPAISCLEMSTLLQKIHEGCFMGWIEQVQQNLGLTFLKQMDTDFNLCLQHAEEVSDEYKTHFSFIDFAHYLIGVGCSLEDILKQKPNLPTTPGEFWKLVNLGNNKTKIS
jgi:hypothetical protein